MNKKIVIITQARTGSTRLPGKVLKKISEKTLLEIHLSRILKSKLANTVVLATTSLEQDDPIVDIGEKVGVQIYRGSESDVLDRYYNAATEFGASIIVRVTSDCPLIDHVVIDEMIQAHITNKKNFTSNVVFRTFPDGLDVEIFDYDILKRAWEESSSKEDREHVTHYIWKNSDLLGYNFFTAYNLSQKNNINNSDIRLTLDFPNDFELFKIIIEELGYEKSYIDYVNFLMKNPEILKINSLK